MCEAIGWQPHTCLEFMGGLHKNGWEVTRKASEEAKSIYRFGATDAAARGD